MSEGPDLKEGNKLFLSVYFAIHGLVVSWIIIGSPITTGHLIETAKSEMPKAGLALLAGLLITILNRQVKSNFKEVLIFWRIKNPLPGSRAFSNLTPNDPFIDVGRLKQAVGGALPTDPSEQNRVWYRLYQRQKDLPSIMSSHKDYLLSRDITWLTILLSIICPLALVLTHHTKAAALYFGACAVVYFLSRRAARVSAESFVATVLACAAANEDIPSNNIIQI